MDRRPALPTESTPTIKATGTVSDQRLYQLIRQPKRIAERRLDIEFVQSGVEAFSFTFG